MGANLHHKDKTSRTPLDYIIDINKREEFQRALEVIFFFLFFFPLYFSNTNLHSIVTNKNKMMLKNIISI